MKFPAFLGVFDRKDSVEFSDVCRYYFGKWGEYVAALFSLATLLGATIVYWVLMSNFLYFTGAVVHGKFFIFILASVSRYVIWVIRVMGGGK